MFEKKSKTELEALQNKLRAVTSEKEELQRQIRELASEVGMLAEAAGEGKLDTRGDASKFQGDFSGIVQGVND
ncbi:MAG: methyl-accepting chemotaxis protein, partial [Candidatus Latescibacteria bacterium]|nr:methyl-accepting chemotaxis protein [Candidatus Latescibacterota bacterium]